MHATFTCRVEERWFWKYDNYTLNWMCIPSISANKEWIYIQLSMNNSQETMNNSQQTMNNSQQTMNNSHQMNNSQQTMNNSQQTMNNSHQMNNSQQKLDFPLPLLCNVMFAKTHACLSPMLLTLQKPYGYFDKGWVTRAVVVCEYTICYSHNRQER